MIRKTALALSALALAAVAAAPAQAAAQRTITCQSYDGRTNHCDADVRGGVRLVRRLSDAACVQGRSWGIDRRGIWVSRGCRAEFVVGGRRGEVWDRADRDRWEDRRDRDRWDDRGRGRVARAEQVCRAAVRDRLNRNGSGSMTVRYMTEDRRGNSVVRWRTQRASGACIVGRNGRLLDFSRNRI